MNRKPIILVAPGPYKESLDAQEVAAAIREGIENVIPDAEIILRPMADGGSGFARLLTEVTGGRLIDAEVESPLGDLINTQFGLLGDGNTAVIESASAAGLSLVPVSLRNPLNTSTYGVGQLIDLAIRNGAQRIIVGCGDSATNDCGIGAVAGLGVSFYESNGADVAISRPAGKHLQRLTRIDFNSARRRLRGISLTVACNLTSVLCGPDGTSQIYGPQKGATPQQVEMLHKGVEHFCNIVFESSGMDIAYIPGAGGSGGLAASLYAFFGAKLLYSLDVIDSFLDLDKYLRNADVVFTGEGRIDDRTATGKIVCGVALRAKKFGIPTVAIVGSISSDHEDIFYNGIDAIECIADGPMTREESMTNARQYVKQAAERATRFMFIRT